MQKTPHEEEPTPETAAVIAANAEPGPAGSPATGLTMATVVPPATADEDAVPAAAGTVGGTMLSAPHRPGIWTAGTLVYTASGLVLLFCWLLWGDFALSMRERSVGPLIEKFLLKNGSSNTLKQLLTATLPTAIALVLGPAVSYMSDRTRSPWGRRIPYLLVPTPIAGAAMVGIAFCPQMGEWLYTAFGNVKPADVSIHVAASAYTLSIFTILWTIFEVAVIISGSVMGGLINDVVPRPVLGRFHGLFRAVSLFDGILFNSLLFQHAEQHFTLMFAMIGLLFGGGFTLMCLKVREGNYPPPPVEKAHFAAESTGVASRLGGFMQRFYAAAFSYLRECFTQPYYLFYFALVALSALTFRPINDFTIRYAAQLGMADANYGFLVGVSYLMSLILAFPLGMLVDKFHPIRMSFLAIVLYSVTSLYGSLFVHDAKTFGIALVAHTVLSGTFFTCVASLGQQLLPRAKFSQYASAAGIVASISALLYAPLIGGAIDITGKDVVVDGVAKKIYDYHLTFWAGLGLSVLTMITLLIVYRKFMSYGGTKSYVAPGDEEALHTRHEPPAHMTQILLLYSVGAITGVTAGYVLGYLVQPGAVHDAGVSLASFYKLLLNNQDVRNRTTVCIATAVIPFAIIGAWAGTYWAKRKESSPLAH